MRIKIQEIGKEGLDINTSLDPGYLTNIDELDVKNQGTEITSDILLDLEVTKVLREINISGIVSFSIKSPCARCLISVDNDINQEVRLVILPKQNFPERDGDVDYETYEGDEIDLGIYISEVVSISLPQKILCRKECNGLCKFCGINLNIDSCSCDVKWNDPRFEALRNVKF